MLSNLFWMPVILVPTTIMLMIHAKNHSERMDKDLKYASLAASSNFTLTLVGCAIQAVWNDYSPTGLAESLLAFTSMVFMYRHIATKYDKE